jgi:hypothetical protein
MKYKLLFILFLLFSNCKKADTDLDMSQLLNPQKENLNQTVSIALIKWTRPKKKTEQKSLKQAIFVLKPMI